MGLHAGAEDFQTDDIDHFGNRRIRTVGELIQNQFRIGLSLSLIHICRRRARRGRGQRPGARRGHVLRAREHEDGIRDHSR